MKIMNYFLKVSEWDEIMKLFAFGYTVHLFTKLFLLSKSFAFYSFVLNILNSFANMSFL